MLQLAVGEVEGLMKPGSGTAFLDPALQGTPGLEGTQELLPVGRLCREYDLQFEFDGCSGRLRHAQTGEMVQVDVSGETPHLKQVEYDRLRRMVRASAAMCGAAPGGAA